MTPFWYGWPSWATELIGGAALSLSWLLARWGMDALWAPTDRWQYIGFALFMGIASSAVYESRMDLNGWSWRDVGQRFVGQLLGLGLWLIGRSL